MDDAQKLYVEQFRSAGQLPTGPISPWPKNREIRTVDQIEGKGGSATKVKATAMDQLRGLGKTAATALRNGQCHPEVRAERIETCFSCPHFIEKSARCSLCGCYMKAKSWVDGDPKKLCPAKKWVR